MKKSFLSILAIFTSIAATGAWAQSPPPVGMVGYGFNGTTPSSWICNNVKLAVATGSQDLSSCRGTNTIWTDYVDGCCIYSTDIYNYVLGTAAMQGWADPEAPFLHMNVDYAMPGGTNYSGIDQFDVYEQSVGNTWGQPSKAIHGIFTLVGSTYNDVTVQAYCPTIGVPTDQGDCSNYRPTLTTVSDRLLIGYQIPFDTVNITIDTPRSGGTVTWQYWNGSAFSSLTLNSDTTSRLTTTGMGTVTFLPPSNWVPSSVHGSQSKYWVQITVSGAGTSPKLAKVYGDNLLTGGLARGWNDCAGGFGHINMGTPVDYCGSPEAGSTARFRQQARQVGYGKGAYNDFFGNPINTQMGNSGSQNTWAVVELQRTIANLAYGGMNGVMLDDVASVPHVTDWTNADWTSSDTELGSKDMPKAWITLAAAFHALTTAQFGSSPKWWDGGNVPGGTQFGKYYDPIMVELNWVATENMSNTVTSAYTDTTTTEYLCTDSLWCPGQSTSNNPLGTQQVMQIQDFGQAGIKDGNGSSLSDYHAWDMSQRGPMNALAMFYMVSNPNILFSYDPAGTVYASNGADYYRWVLSSRTLLSPVTASTCASGCTVTISGALETSACPGLPVVDCPIRIGGAQVNTMTGYTGTSLSTSDQLPGNAILANYSAGASIEYLVKDNFASGTITPPVFMYGGYVPASGAYLGTPDSTYGYDKPCTSSTYYIDGGCFWKSGKTVSGNPGACTEYDAGSNPPGSCSPLLRRDFTGGTYGSAIVLLRPTTPKDNPTASTEYDTPSQMITLPGTYYELMADGEVSGTPATTTTLRGGEAKIYVAVGNPIQTVATPSISPNGETYSNSVTVTLGDATSGAQIYYTTDGSVPTQGSKLYSAPFMLTSSATVSAIGFENMLNPSTEAQAQFTITTSSGGGKTSGGGGLDWLSLLTLFGLALSYRCNCLQRLIRHDM